VRLVYWLVLIVAAAGCGGDDRASGPPTASATATSVPTATATLVPSSTATLAPTVTRTHTATALPSNTPTATAEPTATATADCSSIDCTLADTATQAGLWIGAAIADPQRAGEQAVVGRDFNSITAENAMKWGSLAPRVGAYDFTAADAVADFAAARGVRLRGHTLLWRDQQPTDLATQVAAAPDPAAHLRGLIEQHFTAVLSRYRGRVAVWDVVNEPLQVGTGQLDANLFMRTLGPGYLAEAFQLAHQLDPDAALCLNEFLFSYSADDPKAQGLATLVRELRDAGLPLHVVGLQAHFFGFNPPPSRSEWERLLRLFTGLGVRVELTEVDVSLKSFAGDPDPLARQAAAYGDLTAACRAVPGCDAITVWGIDDAHTWLDRFPPFDQLAPHQPLLFDAALQAKSAHAAVRQALR
jgi:endo-1,4-beta-xylanase